MTELATSWKEFVEVVYRRDLGSHEAERLLSAFQSAGRDYAERLKQVTPTMPTPRTDAVPVQSPDEKLKAAGEIREVVQQFLRASPEKARSQLPADWAPKLPLEVGAAEVDSDGQVHIGVWRLNLQGDRAQLEYYPPGAITAHDRFWFKIELTRKSDGWEILPPGVSFVHAWAKEL